MNTCEHGVWWDETCGNCCEDAGRVCGVAEGAAVAFGLMGMAEAIRARCLVCDSCGAVALEEDDVDACAICNTIYG